MARSIFLLLLLVFIHRNEAKVLVTDDKAPSEKIMSSNVTINGVNYFISSDYYDATHEAVTLKCEALNMRLVSFETAEEQNAILDFMVANSYENEIRWYWIGGEKLINGEWIWTYTGECMDCDFNAWDQVNPPWPDQYFVTVHRVDRHWSGSKGGDTGGYICEQK